MDFLDVNQTYVEDIPIFSSNMELVETVQSSDMSAVLNQSFWKWAQELLHNRTSRHGVDPTLALIKAALTNMRMYYTPAVVVFGILGNTLIWIMLVCSKLRYLSCSHYMAAMIIVNTMHLMALLVQWLTLFGIDLYNTPGYCQFVSFINSLCVFLSIWFVVAFAVDRYIATVHPQHSPIMCTTLRAKVVIISLSLVGFVVYMNISLTVGVINLKGKPRCAPLPMFLHNLRILTVFDTFINIIIPYTAILCITVILMHCQWRQRNKSAVKLPRSPSMDDVRGVNSESNNNDSDAEETTRWRAVTTTRRFTNYMNAPMRKFAIIYFTFFLITHLPSELFRLIHTTKGLIDQDYFSSRQEYYLQLVSQHVYNTSLASHLCLFLLFHEYFREGLTSMTLACVRQLRLSCKEIQSKNIDLQLHSSEVITTSQNTSQVSSVSVTFV